MVLTCLSSYMGFIIIFNQPVGITVGIRNVSETTSDSTCLISITKLNFSRFFYKIIAFLIYRFFLSFLLCFSWRFHRTRAGGTYWPLIGVKCPSCALMLPWVHCPLQEYAPINGVTGERPRLANSRAWLHTGALQPPRPRGQAACTQS